MRSTDESVQKALSDSVCSPTDPAEGKYCHLTLICQRCNRCVGHCVCPPPEERFKPKPKKSIA